MKTLHIENFLLFKDTTIEIKPVTVLIGPQATGKSVIAKLVHIFNEFPKVSQNALLEIPGGVESAIAKIENGMSEIFRKVFFLAPDQRWPNAMKISLTTKTGTLSFAVREKDNSVVFQVGKKYLSRIESLLERVVTFKTQKTSPPETESLQKLAFQFLNDSEFSSTFPPEMRFDLLRFALFHAQSLDDELQESLFIPAGRSYFSVVDINPYSEINESITDYFFRNFADHYTSVLRRIASGGGILQIPTQVKHKVKITHGIIDGEYAFDTEKKKGYIYHNNGLVCEVKNASSGEQEFLPLFLSLRKPDKMSFIIEEPEAHLFPTSQQKVTRFLLSSRQGREVLITTHSPYILTSLNNLLYAGNLSEKLSYTKKEALWEEFPEECLIKSDSISAYFVNDGIAENIIDAETGLIAAEAIDGASDAIDAEFNRIAELGL